MDSIIPASYSLPLRCPRIIFGTPVKIHLTMVVFFAIEFSASLPFITTFPLYCVLVVVLCGPILLATVLVHEWGHLWMSRRILGDDVHDVVLWPLGGYTFCDGLSISTEDEAATKGDLKDDIKIALAGSLTHVPMCLFWFAMYAAINNGDVSGFTFRRYLTVISSLQGFFSTLFEQACLINILLFWFNVFVPAYPLDGSRLMTSSLLLMGVALNKAALLTWFVLILVSIALFAWSIASFVGGVGITGILCILIVFFVWSECYRLYSSIVGGRLREHPLFGRDCYIYRDVRPSMFQLSTAARRMDETADRNSSGEEQDQSGNMTMAPTETDIDHSCG